MPMTKDTPHAMLANDDSVEALTAFEDGLPVRLISTPREKMKTCRAEENVASVIERNRVDQFDHLPVTAAGASGRIIGLIELASFRAGTSPEGTIGNHMQPLSEENLIGADAGILSFVRDADRHRLRLIVAGRDISGLVSLFDIQKLPARAALFAIVTQLEIVMTSAIRREFGRAESWLERLTPDLQSLLQAEIKKAHEDDSFVDSLLFTQLADKATIIRKNPNSPFEPSTFKSEFFKIQELRNQLAHAKEYALTLQAASRVCETVRLIDEWSSRLSQWP
jgi:CBS domain-containing protein